MTPDAALVERFARDLDALVQTDARVGLAVSGGPDSLALLLLAAAARPGLVEAATVDHRLRPESREEAETVEDLCALLDIPHEILTVEWDERPAAAIQERARQARYAALGSWAGRRRLAAVATAHHADDQAETLIMRLNRGAGVRGLAAMRPEAVIPGDGLPLVRPLLGWRRSELEEICAGEALDPANDPSNADVHYERVRVRQGLASARWLDPAALARSASHLAAADDALEWAAEGLAADRITAGDGALRIDPTGLPLELQRRLLLKAFARFDAVEPGGPELLRALAALVRGGTATLSGLKLDGGQSWRITRAPPRSTAARTRPVDNLR